MTQYVSAARIGEPGRTRRLVAALVAWWQAWRAPTAVQSRRRLRLHRAHLRRVRRHDWWMRQTVWWGRARQPLFVAGGFVAFTVGAWKINEIAGIFVLGASLWLYDFLRRPRGAQ